MLDYKTQLFILKEKDSGELNRIITVYTKDFGKKTIKLRSAYKVLSKLNSHIQFFSIIEADIVSGKSFDYVCNAIKETFYFNIQNNLKKSTIYYFILEILDKFLENNLKDIEIYNLYIRYFEYLDKLEYVDDNNLNIYFKKDKELIMSLYKFLLLFFRLNGINIKKEHLKDGIINKKEDFFEFIYYYVEKYLKMEKLFIDL